MKTIRNDVFRMVNLRGSRDDLIIDPDSDPDVDVDGPVIRAIHRNALDAEQLESLSHEMASVTMATQNSPLARLAQQLTAEPSAAYNQTEVTLYYGGEQLAIKQLAAHEPFRKDFANAYNAWLLLRLQHRDKSILQPLEEQLRVGYWLYSEGSNQAASITPFTTSPSRRKVISLPQSLRERITKTRYAARPTGRYETPQAAVSPRRQNLQAKFYAAEAQIAGYDAIEQHLHDTLLATIIRDSGPTEDYVFQGKSRTGLLQGLVEFLFGRTAKSTRVNRSEPTLTILDDALVATVKQALSPNESTLLDITLADLGPQPSVEATLEALSLAKNASIEAANQAFVEVLAAEQYGANHLPEPTAAAQLPPDGAVQPLGWGDLIVATETLIDYEAREIAHIENILPNEKKNRDHTRSQHIEDTFETEITTTEESQRELETTDRHELQFESSKAIAEEFAIQTGVNTSGRYGLTKVETSLDASFRHSTQESQTATSSIANEVIAKAVERTFKQVRELRRHVVTTEVVELNKHEINNVRADGAATSAISGIYKWVEKVHQLQLRHYGTRMMVEFSIPEPALSIVGRIDEIDVDVDRPTPPPFDAGGIDEGNYLAWSRIYDAVGVSPPPERFVRVGFAWKSQPSERENEGKSEDVLGQLIAIPEQYRPRYGVFSLSAHPAYEDQFQVRLQIADQQFSQDGDAIFRKWFHLPSADTEAPWPVGVPISMTAHGHFDKTLSMNVVITCVRRVAALRQWQLATFAAIQAGYERQLQRYNEALETARLKQGIPEIPIGTPDAINRRTEREELQKWSIKLLRRDPLDLDAVVKIGADDKEHDEIDPGGADSQASLIRFYEEAFEWDNMSYFFYPYFWGRRNAWNIRQDLRHNDYRFEAFLRAGAARVIVPATPGYEAKVIFYLSNPDLAERERIAGPPDLSPTSEPPQSVADSVYETMWLELMLNKNEELALGSGFLDVTKDSTAVGIIESTWEATERDIGRELFIRGDRYEVVSVSDAKSIVLSTPYEGEDDPRAPYATGSVAFGPPWLVNLPTNLVVLNDNKEGIHL